MPKKKSLYIAVLLLFAQFLLMGQEIVLQKVFCYKQNGTVDVELAFLGMGCFCIRTECCSNETGHDHSGLQAHDHSHDHAAHPVNGHRHPDGEPGNTGHICPSDLDCFDQPFGSNWLDRLADHASHYRHQLAKQWQLAVSAQGLNAPVPDYSIEAVPLRKFLITLPPDNQNDGVILTC